MRFECTSRIEYVFVYQKMRETRGKELLEEKADQKDQ